MKTIAIVNLKGGVGKTVTSINMAALLATEHGKRVLLVDADAQGSATKSLLPEGQYNTLAALLIHGEAYYENLIYPSTIRNLDVLPADEELRNLEINASVGGPSARIGLNALRDLRDALTEDDAYDYVIIDCPPAFTPACAAAIAAATAIIIPIKVDKYAVEGMRDLTMQIAGVRRIHPDVHVAGCLVTMWYRAEAVLQGEEVLRKQAPVRVFGTKIRRTPKVDESTWMDEPVITWSPRSAAAQDYRRFVGEFLAQEGGAEGGR